MAGVQAEVIDYMSDLKETVAKNVGVSVDALNDRIGAVLTENKDAWNNAGKSDEECEILAIRVAGRQLKAESSRIEKSGATVLEGMAVSSPRYKDFAANAYKKMKTTLTDLDEAARSLLVAQGRITIIEDNLDGSYTHTINPTFKTGSLGEDTSQMNITSLPKFCEQLDATTWFQLIENNTTPVFPSGDPNPRFGRARRLTEPVREVLFLSRARGTDNDLSLTTLKLEGELAKGMIPTFIPGSIAVRMGKNGVGYAKPGLTSFTRDDRLASIFPGPPFSVAEDGPVGSVVELMGGVWPDGDFLPSFDLLPEHINKWAETDERWDKLCGLHGEVVHIDPRERGGYIVTVGDLEITSTAPAIDVYVPAEHSDLVDFGVGSQIVLVGRGWMSRDGDARFDCTGWWVCDSIVGAAPAQEASEEGEDGWDVE